MGSNASTTPALPFSAEALQLKTKKGAAVSMGGPVYVQYGASTAVTNAGPSSLFSASAGSKGSLTFPAGFFNWNNGYDPAGTAPNITAPGCRLRLFGRGTLVSSGTDTLLFGVKLTNSAGTAQVLAVNSTAAALVTVTNATTVATTGCELAIDITITGYGATGSITTAGLFTYSATPLLGVAPLGIRIPSGTPVTTVSAYDVTQTLTLDVYVTSSGAASSLTMTSWVIEALN
jgi:hypothetical protein